VTYPYKTVFYPFEITRFKKAFIAAIIDRPNEERKKADKRNRGMNVEAMEKKIETGPYSEDSILLFEEGLIGFSDCKSFVFLGSEGIAPFRRLQSTDRADLSFLVLDPRFVVKDYLSYIPAREWEALGLEDHAARMAVVICSIGHPPERSTGNFQAPIIINYAKMIGRQVILSEGTLSPRQPLHNTVQMI